MLYVVILLTYMNIFQFLAELYVMSDLGCCSNEAVCHLLTWQCRVPVFLLVVDFLPFWHTHYTSQSEIWCGEWHQRCTLNSVCRLASGVLCRA